MTRRQRRDKENARLKYFKHVADCTTCGSAPYDMGRIPVRRLDASCHKGRLLYKTWNDLVEIAAAEEREVRTRMDQEAVKR